MSHWNCRVIRHYDSFVGEYYYMIHEVYYDDENKPISYSSRPFSFMTTVKDEENDALAINQLKDEMEKIKRALEEKVLDADDFKDG